eukprot:symbB.v1.2.015480.t1/scaffold1156.1/size134879/10
MQSQERRAQNLKEVVASSESGLSEMAKLLEGQERRTFDLGEALSTAGKELLVLTNRLEDSGQSISDQLRQMDAMYSKPSEVKAAFGEMSNKDNDAIWKALRELQELVVHESEHRAAGLREVLGVLGRDTEQLRSDLNRHETELEGRFKADSLKIRQHIAESQSRIAEYDQHTERLEKRLDALSNALTAERNARIEAFLWIEEQVREAHAPGQLSSPAPRLLSSPIVRSESPQDKQPVVNQSSNRIQVQEARYERKLGPEVNGSPRQPTTAAMDKLRGQLAGLQAELKASGGPSEVGVPILSPRQPQVVVSISSPMPVQAHTQVGVMGIRDGLSGVEVDGIDALQPRVIYTAQAPPLSTVSRDDLNPDGRTDLEIIEGIRSEATSVHSGAKVTLSTGPAKGYVRPTEYSIATFGSQNEHEAIPNHTKNLMKLTGAMAMMKKIGPLIGRGVCLEQLRPHRWMPCPIFRAFSSGDDGYRAHSASAAAACPEDEENLAGMRVGALRMMQHGAGRSIAGAKSSRRRPNWVAAANLEDQTQEVRRSNIDERQFLTNDGAEGKTIFERARSASRNRLQRSVVAAAEYRSGREDGLKSTSGTPISMEDRDLEEIEQDVEEQIQIAIANGEFDNVEGKGKPLKSLLGNADNPYLDRKDRLGLQTCAIGTNWNRTKPIALDMVCYKSMVSHRSGSSNRNASTVTWSTILGSSPHHGLPASLNQHMHGWCRRIDFGRIWLL